MRLAFLILGCVEELEAGLKDGTKSGRDVEEKAFSNLGSPQLSGVMSTFL